MKRKSHYFCLFKNVNNDNAEAELTDSFEVNRERKKNTDYFFFSNH